MNTKALVVSVVLILAGICGATALAGASLGANSNAIKGLSQAPNSTTGSGGVISPILIVSPNNSTGSAILIKQPPSIYTFEQYIQLLLDANDGSATVSIVAKGGVITISSPSVDLKSDTMTLTASNLKCVIDKNTGIITISADSIKYAKGINMFSADNFLWSMTQTYPIYNSSGEGVIPPVAGK
jgi:hypothetical protein